MLSTTMATMTMMMMMIMAMAMAMEWDDDDNDDESNDDNGYGGNNASRDIARMACDGELWWSLGIEGFRCFEVTVPRSFSGVCPGKCPGYTSIDVGALVHGCMHQGAQMISKRVGQVRYLRVHIIIPEVQAQLTIGLHPQSWVPIGKLITAPSMSVSKHVIWPREHWKIMGALEFFLQTATQEFGSGVIW